LTTSAGGDYVGWLDQKLADLRGAARMSRRMVLFSLVVLLGLAGALKAQNGNLGSDVGEVSFANSGSAAAQQPFLRGLAQLHNFEFDSAAEEFRKAQSADANFAMAYWGEAMSYNHPLWAQQDAAAARAVLQRLGPDPAARLAKTGTERERDYLRAVETLYGEGTKEERDFKYADAMAAVHAKYPDDTEASAFYALALLGTAHQGRDFTIYMRAAGILQPLFYAYPRHPGIAHYLIHSFDDPVHAPLGLPAARSYSKIAAQAPHALHMTSHIFVAMGMWDDVVEFNDMAARVQDQQNARRGLPPTVCGHYNIWLEYGYLQQGRMRDARKALEICRDAAMKSASTLNPSGAGGSLAGGYAQMWLRYLIDSDDWSGEVARWPVPSGANAAVKLTFDFANGYGAVRRGDLRAARAALAALSSTGSDARAAMPGMGGMVGTGNATQQAYVQRGEILREQLQAMISAAEGRRDGAIISLRKAAATEMTMAFEYGPPFVDKPTQELLGEFLLAANRPAEASAAFQAALSRARTRTQSLLGLYQAAKAAGDTKKADEVGAELRAIWRHADEVPQEIR
jgi:Tfp pilus assembly protein PilF